MTLDQLLNPQHHPILTDILAGVEWFLVVVVPTGILLVGLALSWPAARRGEVVASSFLLGTIGYLTWVGLSGNRFGPLWLAAVFFFVGMGFSVGRITLTAHAWLDAAVVGASLALAGTSAIGGAQLVINDELWPHFTAWLVSCAGASIIAGMRRHRKRNP